MVNEILNPCWNNKAVTLKQGWVSACYTAIFIPMYISKQILLIS